MEVLLPSSTKEPNSAAIYTSYQKKGSVCDFTLSVTVNAESQKELLAYLSDGRGADSVTVNGKSASGMTDLLQSMEPQGRKLLAAIGAATIESQPLDGLTDDQKERLDNFYAQIGLHPDHIGVDFQHFVAFLKAEWTLVTTLLNSKKGKKSEHAYVEEEAIKWLKSPGIYQGGRSSTITPNTVKKGIVPLLFHVKDVPATNPEKRLVDLLINCQRAAEQAWGAPTHPPIYRKKDDDMNIFSRFLKSVPHETLLRLVQIARPPHIRHRGRPPNVFF